MSRWLRVLGIVVLVWATPNNETGRFYDAAHLVCAVASGDDDWRCDG